MPSDNEKYFILALLLLGACTAVVGAIGWAALVYRCANG